MIEIKSGYGKLEINNSPEARARFERMREILTADRGASSSYDRCTTSDVNINSFRYAVTLQDLNLPMKVSRAKFSQLY